VKTFGGKAFCRIELVLIKPVAETAKFYELGMDYRVLVQPIIAGKGRRLFDGVNLSERHNLKLVESRSPNKDESLLAKKTRPHWLTIRSDYGVIREYALARPALRAAAAA
jgi:hypothetical protein